MKKIVFSISLFISSFSFAQFDISAGMGISLFSAPEFENYIDGTSFSDAVGSFNTSADFFGEIGYNLNEKYQIAFEYNFNIYSVNSTILDVELDQHKPSIIGYYMIQGQGYKFKFGGGFGIRSSNYHEKINSYGYTETFTTTGFGFLGKAQGDTMLGDNFYAVIAGDIRYDVPGKIKDRFTLSTFSVGLKLGVAYYL